jgi:hypothetical protein
VNRSIARAIALACGVALASSVTFAVAQTKARPARGHAAKPQKPAKPADAGAPSPPPTVPPQAEAPSDSAHAPAGDEARPGAPGERPRSPGAEEDGGVLEAKTLDGGTRVFRFGEVEIEGRLRNPQLVYFLRRVRAEFAAGDLGHRTFLPELSETRHDRSF